jgi:phosphoglycerate dehydrogenase-like enzyme
LAGLENILLTPHVAGATVEAQARIIDATIANVGRAILGVRPIDVVNPEVWTASPKGPDTR